MSLTNKLYKSRKIILEMLRDRGYNTENYENYTPESIDILFKTNMKVTKDINPIDIELEESNKLLIKYLMTPKIRVNNIFSIVEELIEEKTYKKNDTIILIIKDKLTNYEQVAYYFDNIYSKNKIFIQLFNIDMLMYNVTHHKLVPKHIMLKEEEKQNLLKKYNVTYEQLQYILKDEPVAKYYGMNKGDVCKIIRNSETAGEFINYRYCV